MGLKKKKASQQRWVWFSWTGMKTLQRVLQGSFLPLQNADCWVTTPSDPQGEWQFQKLRAAENDTNSALWWHQSGEWEIPFNLMQFKHLPKTSWRHTASSGLTGSVWGQLSRPLSHTNPNTVTSFVSGYPHLATSCLSSRSLHLDYKEYLSQVPRGLIFQVKKS